METMTTLAPRNVVLRSLAEANPGMKLHLGCGNRHIDGFVHVDIVNYPHVDYVQPIDNLSIFEDNSVPLIYNCHVLEHFHTADVPRVLAEWKRVLKPGGVLRTAVPDFAAVCAHYMENGDLSKVRGLLMGRQNYLYNIHYSIFDHDTLKGFLEDVGFEKVKRFDWRETEHADVDDFSKAYLPHMDTENGRLMSLNVEAFKPVGEQG